MQVSKVHFRRQFFFFGFRPTPIVKTTPVDSDVELKSPNFIYFRPNNIEMSEIF